MVPFDMTLDETEECEISDPDIHYHIGPYSTKDFKYRLDPFDYEDVKSSTFLTEEETRRYPIPPKEIIYPCVKPVEGDARQSSSLETAVESG